MKVAKLGMTPDKGKSVWNWKVSVYSKLPQSDQLIASIKDIETSNSIKITTYDQQISFGILSTLDCIYMILHKQP